MRHEPSIPSTKESTFYVWKSSLISEVPNLQCLRRLAAVRVAESEIIPAYEGQCSCIKTTNLTGHCLSSSCEDCKILKKDFNDTSVLSMVC